MGPRSLPRLRVMLPVALSLSLVLLILSCLAWADDAPPSLVEQEVRAFPKIERSRGDLVVINSCGDHIAYVRNEEGELQRVVRDGKEEKAYAEIIAASLQFSCDGKRFGYFAKLKKGEHPVLVLDGREFPAWYPYETSEWFFVFSPDGKHYAHISRGDRRQEHLVSRDGRIEKGYGKVGVPAFSPDSKHLAYSQGYAAQDPCIVFDDRKQEVFKESGLGAPVWAPDSKSYAHTVLDKDHMTTLVWGRARLGPCEKIEGLVFSPDSKRLAWKALARDKWFVFINDKKMSGFAEIGTLVFSPDSKRLAYAATDRDKWFVVLDEKKSGAYDSVGEPVFSPDGKHLACWASRDGKTMVVCDKKEAGDYTDVAWVGFSSDSKHLAVLASRGNDKFVVIDGVEGKPHQRIMVPERFERLDDPEKPKKSGCNFCFVVIDSDEPKLVQIDWPADRTLEEAFNPAAK